MMRSALPLVRTFARSQYRCVALLVPIVLLTACGGGGGGGGGSPSAAATPAQQPQQPKAEFAHGLYKGTSNDGRSLTVLVVNSGRVYAIAAGNVGPSHATNLYFGNGIDAPTTTAGTYAFNSSGVRDFPVPNTGLPLKVETVALGSAVIQANSIEGKLTRPGVDIDFTAIYDTNFNGVTPKLSTIAGVYQGNSIWGSTDANEQGDSAITTLSVSAVDGMITAGPNDCPHTGQINPHPVGNVYAITLNYYIDIRCRRGDTFVGHAILELSGTDVVLTVMAANNGFTKVVSFFALKQP
jgi:hypothetical protein